MNTIGPVCPVNKQLCAKGCVDVCAVTGYAVKGKPVNEELKPSISERLTAKQVINPIHTEDQEQENRNKYGPRQDDTIARAFRHSKLAGDVYCNFMAQKYLTRYISNSKKSNNPLDLKKAIDYIQRMIEMNLAIDEDIIEK